MTFKNLMIAELIIGLGFGLVYIVFPQYLVDEYLVDKTPLGSTAYTLALHYGTCLIAIGIASWFCRNAQPSFARRAFLIIPIISDFSVVIISIYLLSKNIETSAIWLVIVLCGALTTWASWLLSKEVGLDLK